MALANGYNVIIKQVTTGGNTPIYPITRTKDVQFTDGTTLQQWVEDLGATYVLQSQIGAATSSGVKGVAELDTNGTVPTTQLPSATSSAQGAVKIADALPADPASDASDVAASEVMLRAADALNVKLTQIGVATSGNVKGVAELDSNTLVPAAQLPAATGSVKGAVKIADALPADPTDDASDVAASEVMLRAADALNVKLSQLGVATAGGVTGVATLGTDGLVPASQLPSYVDDVIDCAVDPADLTKVYNAQGAEITPETGKIYIADIALADPVCPATNKTYRWSGTTLVEISSSLVLGTTHDTAAYGDEGLVSYRHAMNLNTETGQPETNHNPHNLVAADIATILGYTPVAPTDMVSTTANGLFSSTDYASFLNMKEIIISTTSQGATFASGSGLWLEVIDADA